MEQINKKKKKRERYKSKNRIFFFLRFRSWANKKIRGLNYKINLKIDDLSIYFKN